MSRVAYVNGRYLAHHQAAVHIEDRGYQFGDGVYEVVMVLNGQFVDYDGHIKRLYNSLKSIQIDIPISESALRVVMTRMIRLNHLQHGSIYLQITRGVARRDHKFPAASWPAMVMTAKHLASPPMPSQKGVAAITLADERWARRDIKTIQLLPNCLAKQRAAEAGAFEAILVMPDGSVSEGSSSNVWIVNTAGELVTRTANENILNGITRQSVQKIAQAHQLKMVERNFDVAEMLAAREVFITSATSIVTAVTQIDDRKIADGKIGRISAALREDYLRYATGDIA
ncbi:MAG: D-amino-acid transaminase [Candidatus Puniceispirillaceae bacterium]|jgi:D-alanine transaminase